MIEANWFTLQTSAIQVQVHDVSSTRVFSQKVHLWM